MKILTDIVNNVHSRFKKVFYKGTVTLLSTVFAANVLGTALDKKAFSEVVQSPDSINLGWLPNPEADIWKYAAYLEGPNGIEQVKILEQKNCGQDRCSITFNGLLPSTDYTNWVRAIDNAGQMSTSSSRINSTTSSYTPPPSQSDQSPPVLNAGIGSDGYNLYANFTAADDSPFAVKIENNGYEFFDESFSGTITKDFRIPLKYVYGENNFKFTAIDDFGNQTTLESNINLEKTYSNLFMDGEDYDSSWSMDENAIDVNPVNYKTLDDSIQDVLYRISGIFEGQSGSKLTYDDLETYQRRAGFTKKDVNIVPEFGEMRISAFNPRNWEDQRLGYYIILTDTETGAQYKTKADWLYPGENDIIIPFDSLISNTADTAPLNMIDDFDEICFALYNRLGEQLNAPPDKDYIILDRGIVNNPTKIYNANEYVVHNTDGTFNIDASSVLAQEEWKQSYGGLPIMVVPPEIYGKTMLYLPTDLSDQWRGCEDKAINENFEKIHNFRLTAIPSDLSQENHYQVQFRDAQWQWWDKSGLVPNTSQNTIIPKDSFDPVYGKTPDWSRDQVQMRICGYNGWLVYGGDASMSYDLKIDDILNIID